MKRLLEHPHRKKTEYDEGNNFLEHFELEHIDIVHVTNAVGRHHETIFKKCDDPAKEDCFPQRPARVPKVVVPGGRHKNIRRRQQNDGA